MNRLLQLLEQGRLLFTPKAYPKYLNSKLRVFKPSNILKATLALSLVYASYRFYSLVEPSQIIIPYPPDLSLDPSPSHSPQQ